MSMNHDTTISCNVCQDLIPLVLDQVASEDSIELVNRHIADCETCRNCYGNPMNVEPPTQLPDDQRIIKKIKKTIYRGIMVLVLIGGLFGIALTNSNNILYNSILMPVVGALSYVVYRKRWYLFWLSLIGITYVWMLISSWIEEGFTSYLFTYPIFFTVIYAILFLIGVVIAALLTYAFQKEDMVEVK